jgi:hypothetical protein
VIDVPKALAPALIRPSRTPALLALGGSAALVAGGVVATVVRGNAVAQWNSPACLRDGASREQNCGDYEATARTSTWLAGAGYVAGGALAITSLVLFVRSAPRASTTAWAPQCGAGLLSIHCGAAF